MTIQFLSHFQLSWSLKVWANVRGKQVSNQIFWVKNRCDKTWTVKRWPLRVAISKNFISCTSNLEALIKVPKMDSKTITGRFILAFGDNWDLQNWPVSSWSRTKTWNLYFSFKILSLKMLPPKILPLKKIIRRFETPTQLSETVPSQ